MVLYKCPCGNYETKNKNELRDHLNRKNPCIQPEIKNEESNIIKNMADLIIESNQEKEIINNTCPYCKKTFFQKCNVKKLIHLSTIKVYGGALVGEVVESNAINPLSEYGKWHLSIEKLFEESGGIILRLANCFGPPRFSDGNCWSLIINQMFKQAAETRVIQILSKHEQWKSLLPLSCLCDVINQIITTSKVQSGVYNIGLTPPQSLTQIANNIELEFEKNGVSNICIVKKFSSANQELSPYQLSLEKISATGIIFSKNIEQEMLMLYNYLINGKLC